MSSTSSAQLTEEQRTFLESLEEEFKDRYTEKDEEFMATVKEELPLPPIVENWRDERQFYDRDARSKRVRYAYDQDRYESRYRDRVRDGYRDSYVGRYRYHREDNDRYSHASTRPQFRKHINAKYHPYNRN